MKKLADMTRQERLNWLTSEQRVMSNGLYIWQVDGRYMPDGERFVAVGYSFELTAMWDRFEKRFTPTPVQPIQRVSE